jgi:hypothetical protein
MLGIDDTNIDAVEPLVLVGKQQADALLTIDRKYC